MSCFMMYIHDMDRNMTYDMTWHDIFGLDPKPAGEIALQRGTLVEMETIQAYRKDYTFSITTLPGIGGSKNKVSNGNDEDVPIYHVDGASVMFQWYFNPVMWVLMWCLVVCVCSLVNIF